MAKARRFVLGVAVSTVLTLSGCASLLGVESAPEPTPTPSPTPTRIVLDGGPTLNQGWPFEFDRPLPAGHEWPDIDVWKSHFVGAIDETRVNSVVSAWMASWGLAAIAAQRAGDEVAFERAMSELWYGESIQDFIGPETWISEMILGRTSMRSVSDLQQFVREQLPSYWPGERPAWFYQGN